MIVYVHNRSPHGIFGDTNLEEDFSRVNPKIRHLRIFCCLVYIHVHVEKKKKLDPSRQKSIFMG
jgi:hypothetical protein